MDIKSVDFKDINSNNLKIDNLNILYKQEDSKFTELYITSPILKIHDIVDVSHNTYLQLKLCKKTNSYNFINSILNIESRMKENIKKSHQYFNTKIIKDMYDNLYIKVKISNTLNNIFDINQTPISYNSLKIGDSIKCILNIKNYSICNNIINYDFDIYQLMVVVK